MFGTALLVVAIGGCARSSAAQRDAGLRVERPASVTEDEAARALLDATADPDVSQAPTVLCGSTGVQPQSSSSVAGLYGRPPPRPRVYLANATLNGALEQDFIRRFVMLNKPALLDCQRRALATRPDATGRVTVSLTIDARGAVRSASTRSTHPVPSAASCVRRVFETLPLRAPERRAGRAEVSLALEQSE